MASTTTACQLQKRGSRANTAPTCIASMKLVVPVLNLRWRGGRGARGETSEARMR